MQFNIPAEHKNASGVYIIRSSANSKVYVGSAVNFRNRYNGHCSNLRHGKHRNEHLQRHYNKHGANCFSFDLLELTCSEPQIITEAENRHIMAFDAANREKGFNKMPASLPARHSEETRRKLSESRAGIKRNLSQEQREVLRENAKKLWRNPERRAAAIATKKAANWSPSADNRKKVGDAKRDWWAGKSGEERKLSPEAIAKRQATKSINAALKPPRKCSEETKRRISEANKGNLAGIKWSAERTAKRLATRKANLLKAQGLDNQLILL